MQVAGHCDEKYFRGRRLASSENTRWESILVEQWRHPEGRVNDTKPRDTEIAVLMSGRCRVRRKGDSELQDAHAAAGSVWLCPSGIEETDIEIFGGMDEVVHIFIPAKPFSNSALEDYGIDQQDLQLGYFGAFQDVFLTQVACTLRQELTAPSPAGNLLVDTLRVSMAAYLVRNFSNVRKEKIRLPDASGALDRKRMARVVDYIEANIDRSIQLAELARVACLSTYHFARAFKSANGTTPHRYVTNRKIEFAKRQIESSCEGLSSIALRSGFSSQAHFAKTFKQLTGVTPGEYRNAMSGR